MNTYVFLISLFIAATITLTFALRSWQKGAAQTLCFSLLLGSLSVGTFSYAMELWGADESFKFFWLFIKYMSFETTAVLWWLFVLQFTEREGWLRAPYLFWPALIPILTIFMFISTRENGWVLQNIRLRENTFLVFEFGPYFWVHTGYMYGMFGLGFILLAHWFSKTHPLSLWRWGSLILGMCLPILANLETIFGFFPNSPFDCTPLGMVLGILIIAWVLFGWNFAGVNPIAREALIESLKDGVIVIDSRRLITDVNPAALHLLSARQSLLGLPVETALKTSLSLPSPDIAETYPHQDLTLPGPDGRPRILDLRASPLMDRTHFMRGWLLVLRDITEQKRLQNELEKQSQRNDALAKIELAINQPHDLAGVLKKIVDTTYERLPAPGGATILTWNEETRTFEHADSTLPPDELSDLLSCVQKGRVSASWIVTQQQPKIVPDTRNEPFDDQEVLQAHQILAYAGFPLLTNGKVVGVLYASDTSPRTYPEDDLNFLQTLANRAALAILRVQQFSQVQQQAITDYLTGIYNRRQLFYLGELEFKRARRFQRPLSAIMLDIDHFKQINDTYGHAQGDQVLKALVQFIKVRLREFDIFGRYGGEEFVLVLPGADMLNARNVAYRLRKGVQENPMAEVSITISLGVTELSEAFPDFPALIHQADTAMYEAKRAGRNRVA